MAATSARAVWTAVQACLVLVVLASSAEGASYSDYTALMSSLLNSNNYSTSIRPVLSDTTITYITVIANLLSIVEIREHDQALVTNIKLRMRWKDELLAWTPASHNNIQSLLIPQNRVWRPDLVLTNPVSSPSQLGHSDLDVQVVSDGTVVWTPTVVFETSCGIDVSYYPLDTQKCSIGLMAETALSAEVRLIAAEISLRFYTENGAWEIVDRATAQDSTAGSSFVEFHLKLKRRRFFYVLNLILPVVFLSLTSSLVFALPADAGEKMGLSITVLLAYAVYLLLVSEALPKTSMQASVMAVYLMMLLGLCAVNVVLTVFILRLYHRSDSRPVTGRTARVIAWLRRLFRYPDSRGAPSAASSRATEVTDVSVLSVEEEEGRKSQSASRRERGGLVAHRTPERDRRAGKAGQVKVGPYQPQKDNLQAQGDHYRKFTTGSTRSTGTTGTAGTAADGEGGAGGARGGRGEDSASGRVVAETLDLFLFLLCSVLSLATTLFCMMALVAGSETDALDTTL